jgi:hypothetical protein
MALPAYGCHLGCDSRFRGLGSRLFPFDLIPVLRFPILAGCCRLVLWGLVQVQRWL